MASETDESDKPHDPTPKKLQDARKKGELVKSAEVNTAAMYLGFLFAALIFGSATLDDLGGTLAPLIGRATEIAPELFRDEGAEFSAWLLGGVALSVIPWIVIPFLATLCAIIAQRSLVVAPEKLQFKASRISLLSNFKNKFGWNGIFEFLKSAVKLLIYATILATFLRNRSDEILSAMQLDAASAISLWFQLSINLLGIVFAIAVTFAGVDYLWQHHVHMKRHRMTDKDMKDEHKDSEGDPHLKSARRSKAQQIAFNQMLSAVPEADVVIVNPQHFAVALKWDRTPGKAPVCVAKGVDEIALRIKEIARESGVAIHSDPPTARALYAAVKVEQQIDSEHYQAVAVAIRYAEALRRKRRP